MQYQRRREVGRGERFRKLRSRSNGEAELQRANPKRREIAEILQRNGTYFEDSDNELESLTIACMEEERLHKEKLSRRCRGSVQGHRVIWRDRVQGHERLFYYYFAENPVYPLILFRRRFRMQHSLFLRIQHAVEAYNPYFVQKIDAIGMLGLSSLQKITTAMRMLAYGVAADYVDEYMKMCESTAIESLKKFVQAVVAIFFDEYLRLPNNDDITRLLAVGENHRFPEMLGSIDCMH
ncbi:hypothetical protein HHK36_010235 [Tetracentron sinense]|uniref:Nuclease HARBI1 n=1 Tax=Tetracentron sinense TaxID=13715 RepID=A0A835DJ22_TETSI|nr:hypothetical protein HHK36_010235 [Tetracentron sinense]